MIQKQHHNWEDIAQFAWNIRKRVLETAVSQGGGYLSQACSSAEILAVLYGSLLRLGPSLGSRIPSPFRGVPGRNADYVNGGVYHGAKAPDLDRFIVSPSHYAQAIYAALTEADRLAPEAMAHFNRDGSSVEMIGAEHSPGIEVSGGSFGQALAQAAGIAMARKRKGDTGLVWIFMSDGEFQEGQTWETLLAAAFHRLDNLRVYVDVNGQQVDGRMDEVMSMEPFLQKIEAFGWAVRRVDGHDAKALAQGARAGVEGKPWMTLADTCPFQGLEPLAIRGPKLHYVRIKEGEESKVLMEHLTQLNSNGAVQ